MREPDSDQPDLQSPNAARVYDYYLGGAHNFAVDRDMAEQAIALWPELPQIMRANRAFLRRAVRYCLASGIRQFLDLGSGIPTVGAVHEAAQQAAPGEARVVYVDIDPVAVEYSHTILAGDTTATVVQEDLRQPDQLLNSPEVRATLDFSKPIAVLLVAVLHFIPDSDDPASTVAAYRDAVPPGSMLILSHASGEGRPDQAGPHQDLYRRTATPMTMRSRAAVLGFLAGWEIVPPGIVFLPQWRPDSPGDVDEHPERFTGLAGVGRKAKAAG